MFRPAIARCAAGLALALCAVTACSGGSGTPVALTTPSATQTPSPHPTKSPRPSPSRTVKPTPSPKVTPPVARPARDGDVDGDGKPDHVTVAAGASSDVWTVTARLTTGGTRLGQVHDDTDTPYVAGIVDADGDGFAEIWLHSGAGASTQFLTPLRLIGGVLREVTLRGRPAQLVVGGTVTHGDGFACTDEDPSKSGKELVLYDASSIDGSTWQTDKSVYRWGAEGRLVLLSRSSDALTVAGPGDPRIRPYYSVDCGSLGD